MNLDTASTVRTLAADGKGILAADETPGTGTPLPPRAREPSFRPIDDADRRRLEAGWPVKVPVPVRRPYGGART